MQGFFAPSVRRDGSRWRSASVPCWRRAPPAGPPARFPPTRPRPSASRGPRPKGPEAGAPHSRREAGHRPRHPAGGAPAGGRPRRAPARGRARRAVAATDVKALALRRRPRPPDLRPRTATGTTSRAAAGCGWLRSSRPRRSASVSISRTSTCRPAPSWRSTRAGADAASPRAATRGSTRSATSSSTRARRREPADFWTGSFFGERVRIEYLAPAGVGRRRAAVRGGQPAAPLPRSGGQGGPEPGGEKAAGPCHNDVTCYPEWADVAQAVSGIGFVEAGGSFFCTGQLLNDQAQDFTPYYLTAHHCLSTAAARRPSAEFFWLYQTPSCNGNPPSIDSVPRSDGRDAGLHQRRPPTTRC